jgi:hypothetical protein
MFSPRDLNMANENKNGTMSRVRRLTEKEIFDGGQHPEGTEGLGFRGRPMTGAQE